MQNRGLAVRNSPRSQTHDFWIACPALIIMIIIIVIIVIITIIIIMIIIIKLIMIILLTEYISKGIKLKTIHE